MAVNDWVKSRVAWIAEPGWRSGLAVAVGGASAVGRAVTFVGAADEVGEKTRYSISAIVSTRPTRPSDKTVRQDPSDKTCPLLGTPRDGEGQRRLPTDPDSLPVPPALVRPSFPPV